ncbi:hypothetical protein AAIB33_08130 [Microbacterium sp. AZCO]|uniref:hypothetical protein n=1 Tax=Microbacterium sp. AZCO TaxID=3142976 RepID=UPI0031F3A32E
MSAQDTTAPAMASAPGKRRFTPFPLGTAAFFNRDRRSVEIWASKGWIEIYEVDGQLVNDVDEIDDAMKREARIAKKERRKPRFSDGRLRSGRVPNKPILAVGSYEIIGG